jgi:peptidoglycan/xylan/chitin deacetylase (PgdA/CDA1 family)
MYKQPQVTDTPRFLRSVEEACDTPLPVTAGERLFLSWTEAAALASAGMSIGSHTHRHELLSKLSEAEQREECAASRRILFEKLGISVSALSYPVGSRESFTAATKKCLSETGYEVAFSYYGGVNMGHMDPFNLLRIAVDPMALPQYRFRMAVAATLGRQLW